MTVDPTARIEVGAEIGMGTSIGPHCFIGAHVSIGPACRLISNVYVTGRTSIGAGCTIYPQVSLGAPPQSLNYRGEPTRLEIGEGCTIREQVTMNAGTAAGGGVTRVGDRGHFMNCSHVAHDCVVGNDVVFATSATIGGHCQVGDFAVLGRLSAAHQFVRIGTLAMVEANSCARSDVIPFGLARGQSASLVGLNIEGMKRRNFTSERLAALEASYQALFHGAGIFAERLCAAREQASRDPAIAEILAFIDSDRHRSLCLPAKERCS